MTIDTAASAPLAEASAFTPEGVPPVAKIEPTRTEVCGEVLEDPYHWLRDRDNPETIAYLDAENAYTKTAMRGTEALQARIYDELLGRIQQTDETVPTRLGDYLYYVRTEEGKQYSIWRRRRVGSPVDETLIDGYVMAEGKPYFRVGNFEPSPDNRYIAYSVDFAGDEMYTIRVLDTASGETLPEAIPNTYYSLEWANDNRTFFYVTLDDALRPYRVYRHSLGEPVDGSADTLVYEETDERFHIEVSKTSSERYLLIESNSSLTSEVWRCDADAPLSEWRVVLPRKQGVEYDLTHRGESFFIRTNADAKTFRVVEVPVASPSEWTDVLPWRPAVTVEEIRAFADYLAVAERENGLPRLRRQRYDGNAEASYIDFPEPVYTADLSGNTEFETSLVRFRYSSLVTPESVFDYDMTTGERTLMKQRELPSGYDASLYRCERIHATAPDGVAVPISLVYRKDTRLDGSAPMHLYGYGSYGISVDPSFKSDRLSLLDRGVVCAIAHIRGGGDLGKTWHESGRLLLKKNTFTDFIAAAEHLIASKYTSADRLAIEGRSAGGLLVGAVVTMRPDLFAAVHAGVPFVDALNTMLDASLPLTIGEYEEWGNPAEPDYFAYIKSYAPYENVRPAKYPKMLITAGLNDPRVSYWEPAKFAARIRVASPELLLLKTEMGAGHFGSSGRYEYLKETAFNYSFLLTALGAA